MIEYAHVAGEDVGQIERLASPLPDDHPKLVSGALLPVVDEDGFDAALHVLTGGTTLVLETDRVRRARNYRDKNSDEIAEMKAAKVAAIKAEAQRRIYEIMPLHAQNNSLALFAEATLTHGPDASQWPEPLQDAVQERMAAWDTIKAIREASDGLEADVEALTTAAEVASFDITAGWPE